MYNINIYDVSEHSVNEDLLNQV